MIFIYIYIFEKGQQLTIRRIHNIVTGPRPIAPLGNTNHVRIFSMSLDMFLFILWPFESLPTKLAPMRLQRDVNADMRRDVIPLDDFNLTVTPSTDQIQVIGAFAANVDFADMVLNIEFEEEISPEVRGVWRGGKGRIRRMFASCLT